MSDPRLRPRGPASVPAALEVLRPTYRRIVRPFRRLRATLPARLAGAPYRLDVSAVALTFDDGPHPRHTHEVLDLLASHDVRATFFLVGRNAERHPDVVQRIVAEGHAVGSHSLTHPVPWQLPRRTLWDDYRSGHLAVSEVLGTETRLFRPPKGYLDVATALVLRRRGAQPYLWSLDAADWEPGLTGPEIADRLGDPRPGDVVLLHDAIEGPIAPAALDRSGMVDGLARFLGSTASSSVRFVTLVGS